ncbi:MAG: T9SS type A sorting domain-containing protein, partial [Bacteroidia bacterium]|nr:T9SS type A sorting domain-containing protein [Bacteroidia bacterium]
TWEIRNAQNIVVLRSTPDVRTYGNFEITPGNYTFICRPKVIPPPLEIKILPIIGDTINETINWSFDTVIIRNFSIGSTQNYTYKWLPEQEIVGQNTPEKDYLLSIIAPNGCSGNDSVTIIPKPFKIKVNGYTYGAIIGPLNCGTEIQIDSTLTNYTGKSKLTFKWSDPKLIHDTNSYYPRITPVKNGFISLQAFTQNGCTAADSIQFKVEPIFLKIIDTAVTCKTVFKPSIVGNYNGKHPMVGTWFPNIDLNSANVYRPMFTANINRDYIAHFTNQIGCNATDTFSLQLTKSKASPICLVNVNSDNKNEIIIDKSEGLNVEKFLLWKEGNISNNYYLLGEIPYNQPYLYIDTASNPLVQSNKYTLEKIDVCGITSERSEPHKTMHLTINKGAGNSWNLIWEKYEGFTVSTYNVYRGTSPTNLQQIGTSSGANNSYSDLNPPAGDVFYMVEIISPNNCSPSKTYNNSRSNIMSNKYLSVANQVGIGNVLIYPNPTTNELTIQLEGKSAKHKLQLYSMMGQLLYEKESEEIQSSVSMAEYPTGTYIFIISNANGKVQRLVVKN